MKVECDNCGKIHNKKPSRLKLYKHTYCSQKCHYEHRHKLAFQNAKRCLNGCGNRIRKGKKFCSHSCYFRYMWKTTWKHKRVGKYEPAKRKFTTIILRVPQPCLTNFELEMRRTIKQFNKDYGGLTGKIRINIIGERRL